MRDALEAWLRPLREVPLALCPVTLRATAEARWAEPLNTLLRGVLGSRLRALRCLTGAPDCGGCPHTMTCDYAGLFETPGARTPGAHGARGVHPFWLRGVPAVQSLAAGSVVNAELWAVGFGVPLLPYLEVSLREAAARLQPTPLVGLPGQGGPRAWPHASYSSDTWKIETLTPCVVDPDLERGRRSCPGAPWLPVLVRAMVRRAATLMGAFAPEIEREPAPLLDLSRVEILGGGLTRWSASRFSARQGQWVPLRGWTGSLTVRGDVLWDIGPLFQVAARTGIGKNTALGFGGLRISMIL
ncbi:MAG: CRISPR system precrRNA processing endoribonuclease RAMP protein Cas6 [Deltaproteobacteria bacterium]|nr:CRISPR system precrRNA processing endoribonuclease RAMP protein Cas6 [Deltaproteobacteria bacterium]